MLKGMLLSAGGYIIGSIPTGYLIAKAKGINIKEEGSGNIGATNMTRVFGKRYGALTLILDGLKALLYMMLVKKFISGDNNYILHITGLLILIGNCFSLFLKFDGGKGGVTTYGVFLAIAPISALISIASYVLIGKLVNISAAGTLSSVVILPFTIYFLYPDKTLTALAIIFAVIVWIRHKSNIKAIIEEYRQEKFL